MSRSVFRAKRSTSAASPAPEPEPTLSGLANHELHARLLRERPPELADFDDWSRC